MIKKFFTGLTLFLIISCSAAVIASPEGIIKPTIAAGEEIKGKDGAEMVLIPAERATKVGHPAPFPVELSYRIIHLYIFEGEVVLDPFAGSGSACIVALKTNRKYVAYNIDKKYYKLAERRIKQFLQEQITLFK